MLFEDFLKPNGALESPVVNLRVQLASSVPLDVDSICNRLMCKYQNSRTLAKDSFAAERNHVREILQSKTKNGKLENEHGLRLILDSISSKEMSLGSGKHIGILLDGGVEVTGHVWAKSVGFRAKCSLPNQAVDDLVEFLESLKLGPITVEELVNV